MDLHIDELYDQILNETISQLKPKPGVNRANVNDDKYLITYSKSFSCLLDKRKSVLYVSKTTDRPTTYRTQCYPFQAMCLISDSVLVGFSQKKFYSINISEINGNGHSINAKILDSEMDSISAIFPDKSRENSMVYLDETKHILYRQVFEDLELPEIISTDVDIVSSNNQGMLIQKLDGIHMVELGSSEITERFTIPKISPTKICALDNHFVLFDADKGEIEVYNADGSFSSTLNQSIKMVIDNEITPVFITSDNEILLIEPYFTLIPKNIISACPYEKKLYYWSANLCLVSMEMSPPRTPSLGSVQKQNESNTSKKGKPANRNLQKELPKEKKKRKEKKMSDKSPNIYSFSKQKEQEKLTEKDFPSLSSLSNSLHPIAPGDQNPLPNRAIQQKPFLVIVYGQKGLSLEQVMGSVPEPCNVQFGISTGRLNIFYLFVQSQLSHDDLASAISRGCSGSPIEVFDNMRGKPPQKAYIIIGKGQPASVEQLKLLLSGFSIQTKVAEPYFVVNYVKPKKPNLYDLFFFALLKNVQFNGEKLRVYATEKEIPTVCIRGFPDMPKKDLPKFVHDLFSVAGKDMFVTGNKMIMVNFASAEDADKAVAEADYKDCNGKEIEAVRFTDPLWYEDETRFVKIKGAPPKMPCRDIHKLLDSQGLVHVMKARNPNQNVTILVYDCANNAKNMMKKMLKGIKAGGITFSLIV